MHKLYLYILVADDVEVGNAMVAVAHGVLMCHLEYSHKQVYHNWLQNSFKKVICKVNREQFDDFKKIESVLIVTESTLNNKEVALVFEPGLSNKYHKELKNLKLYR